MKLPVAEDALRDSQRAARLRGPKSTTTPHCLAVRGLAVPRQPLPSQQAGQLRAPVHAGRDSGVMADTVPAA